MEQLSEIHAELVQAAERWEPWVHERQSDRDASARNLLQYLALRRHDLRELQLPLISLGLSSLGRSEGHVQVSVEAVLAALTALGGSPQPARPSGPAAIGFTASRDLLTARTRALLGRQPRKRPTRIMVTMPSEAASNPRLVAEMLHAGMHCARINCAHDTPAEWSAMVTNLRLAEAETGNGIRVQVDLPGPKLRTGPLAPRPAHDRKGQYLRLERGDQLRLTREDAAAEPSHDADIPTVACATREIFAVTSPGHTIWFDDGKLGARVDAASADSILLRITHAPPKGAKLRPGRGINLPDAALPVDILDPSHSGDALAFATRAADIVGLSFVSHAREVQGIDDYLNAQGRPAVGVVLKIETRRAFEQLPGLLLAALGTNRPAGVMIARGDLAVECGFERLAEVQEEILWLCAAAHTPVIWATQVLDGLAKTGRPSRAEITDAAMSGRAECVMLNKGPEIAGAITALDDILRRMARHHRKKRPLLPRLGASEYAPTP